MPRSVRRFRASRDAPAPTTGFPGLIGLLLVGAILGASPVPAQHAQWNQLNLALGGDVDSSAPGDNSQSTVVKIPFSVTIRDPDAGEIGVKLRAPVYFGWNETSLTDIDGEDLSFSLRTMVVTPGVELLIPVGERWLVRPSAEFGAITGLNIGEHAWLGSVGVRASAPWDYPTWRLTTGARIDYSVSWTEDWHTHDDVASLEIGAGISLPLGFDLLGDQVLGGLFVFPRHYFEDLIIDGPAGETSVVADQVEVGISFEMCRRPTVLGFRVPAWYGLGYRFAGRTSSWRVYLGFPF